MSESRGRGARQRNAHARLDNRIPSPPHSRARVQRNFIERMRDRFDQPAPGSGWQSRIGVQSNHVADPLGKTPELKDFRMLCARQEVVEFFDFSALPLSADPSLLGFGPRAWPVEEKKPVARILGVQAGDAVARSLEQSGVARRRYFRSVGKIREQGIEKIRLGVGKESNLQFPEFVLHHGFARKHHRDHDQASRGQTECPLCSSSWEEWTEGIMR